MTRRRLIIEAALVVAAVVAIWAVLYGSLLETCCGAADLPLIIVLLSASQVGGFLTGNLRDPGPAAVLIGLIIEALIAWALCRWLAQKLKDPLRSTRPSA